MISFVRAAITANGGTPSSYTPVGAWRELVSTYGGVPTQYTVPGLIREAITALGGTPTQVAETPLLRELLTTLGYASPSYRPRDNYGSLAASRVILAAARGIPAGATFTRASAASYYNASGAVALGAVDAPRFDYDPLTLALRGLLIEPAGSNLIAYSEAFDNVYWSLASVVVTPNAAAAPDGTTTADLLTPGATNGLVYRGLTADPATNYVFSVWLRSATGAPVATQLAYNGSGADPNPKTQNIAVTTAWQRFSIPMLTTAGGTLNAIIGGYDAPWPSGGNLYAWGAQFEASPAATGYMSTAGGVGLRSADALSFTIPAGFSTLRYVFDDGSKQEIAVSPGAYNVPTNLTRARIQRIVAL